jgi:lipopolysaccharide transport system ATP-binding protein
LALLLKDGIMQSYGFATKVVQNYLHSNFGIESMKRWNLENAPGNNIVKLLEVKAIDSNQISQNAFDLTETVGIKMTFQVLKEGYKLSAAFNFFNSNGINIFDSHETVNEFYETGKAKGCYESVVWLPNNFFSEGLIIIGAAVVTHDPFSIHFHEKEIIAFNMIDKSENNLTRGSYAGNMPGVIRPLLKWQSSKIN